MSQRIATEYVEASMRMSEDELSQFIQQVYDPRIRQAVKILDGGGQELVLSDEEGEEIHLPFHRSNDTYICRASFRLSNQRITNVMRRLFATFQGCGNVYRIFRGFMMLYTYEAGRVCKIVEITPTSSKLVYERTDTMDKLRLQFTSNDVELEIKTMYQEINTLLDMRNQADQGEDFERIDAELCQIAKRLFALEA